MDDHFKTERLSLRPLRISDAAAVAEAANDIDIAKWLAGMPHPYGLDDAKKFINSQKSRKNKALGIFLKDRFIGVIGTEGLIGLGYWLAKPMWGQGFGTEAARAVTDRYFANGNNTVLKSGYITANEGSAAIQRALGFRVIGNSTIENPHQGIMPHTETQLTRNDWLSGHGFPIETARLSLRPVTRGDWQDIRNITLSKAIASMTSSIGYPWSKPEIERWIDTGAFCGQAGFRLAICLHGGRLIGVGGIGGGEQPSLAYLVSEQFQGRGFATEAAQAILQYAFNQLKLTQIAGDTFADNPASIHILETLGFEKVGEDVGRAKARVEPAPVFLYRLTKQKYEGHRP